LAGEYWILLCLIADNGNNGWLFYLISASKFGDTFIELIYRAIEGFEWIL